MNNMSYEILVKNAFTIGGKKFANIPLEAMRVDKEYQRTLKSRAKKIARYWDYNKCDVLVVSYRDGVFYIVDGQHRFDAASQRNVESLPCQIIEGMTQRDEAKKFILQNTEVSLLTPYDTYSANLLLLDPVDTTIDKVCRRWGIVVDGTKIHAAGRLGSLSEARKIVKRHGGECFDWMMNVLHLAQWDELRGGHNKVIMVSLARLWADYKNNLEKATPIIAYVLSCVSPVTLRNAAFVAYPNSADTQATINYLRDKVEGEMRKAIRVA